MEVRIHALLLGGNLSTKGLRKVAKDLHRQHNRYTWTR
jgi:hypothetical protein